MGKNKNKIIFMKSMKNDPHGNLIIFLFRLSKGPSTKYDQIIRVSMEIIDENKKFCAE